MGYWDERRRRKSWYLIYNKEWLWDCEEDKTKSGKRKEERILTEND